MGTDDTAAKEHVSAFLENLWLRPLDVGALQMAQGARPAEIGLARNGAGTFDIASNVDRLNH